MLERYDFSKIEDSKKSKFIFIVAVVVILIAIGVVSWLLAQNPKGKPLSQISTNHTFCQQDGDCALIPEYKDCCSACGREAVRQDKIQEVLQQRQRQQDNLCVIMKVKCPEYKCPNYNYKAVCEQNKCITKVTPVVSSADLLVTLDKGEYQKGEPVNIDIQSYKDVDMDIYNIAVEYFSEQPGGILQAKWEVADNDIQCSCGAKCEKAAQIITSKGTKKIVWDQYTDKIDTELSGILFACKKADAGRYRFKIDYLGNATVGATQQLQTIYSSDFQITEEAASLNANASATSSSQYKIISSYTSPGESSFIDKIGNTVFLTDISEGLLAIDVSNPAKPTLSNKIKIGNGGAYALAADLNDPYLFVSGYGNTKVALVNIKDPAITNVINEIDAKRSVQDMVLAGDYAYLAIDGPEVEIFNVEREKLPPYAAKRLTSKSIINMGGGHAIGVAVEYYPELTLLSIAQGENGVGIYAMNYPTDSPTLQTNISDIGYVGTVAISGNYVYAGVGNKVKIIDVSAKKEVGSIDANEVLGLKVKDSMLYVSSGEEGVKIFDVSDINNPKQIAIIDTPGRARDLVIDGNYIYVADDANDLQIIGKQ